jgi:hypothetical protein
MRAAVSHARSAVRAREREAPCVIVQVGNDGWMRARATTDALMTTVHV